MSPSSHRPRRFRVQLAHGALALATLLFGAASRSHAAYRLVHIAGQASSGFSGDGGPAIAAQLDHPAGLSVAPDGTLYIADTGNNRVRHLAADGTIHTVAGTDTAGGGGDGGPALSAQLDAPVGVAVDAAGNLYIATTGAVRRVDALGGTITTLLGAAFWQYAVANDSAGNVFVMISQFITDRVFGEVRAQPYLLTIPVGGTGTPLMTPIAISGINWQNNNASGIAARDPQHIVVRFDGDQLDYGLGLLNGGILLSYNAELYALGRPRGVALSSSGILSFTADTFYSGTAAFVVQGHGPFFSAIAGGGTAAVVDGALADSVALDPEAITVASDDRLYVVQRPSQVFALQRQAERPGQISGSITPVGYFPTLVSVYARAADGSVRYARVNRRGYFRFPDLPLGQYQVYARFDEEGISCDAANCGIDRTTCSVNDPVLMLSSQQPRQATRLRLMDPGPCG